MDPSELVAKFLEMRIAVDVLEDLLVDELGAVEALLEVGDVDGAKQLIGAMKQSVLEESRGKTDN